MSNSSTHGVERISAQVDELGLGGDLQDGTADQRRF